MNLSVAVCDLVSGREASSGADRTYVTASIVKVSVLAAVLMRAQDAGRWLTPEEEALAARMIERSDNDAATSLREAAGGVAGLDAAHRRLGLTRTSGAAAWGLTRTTARDQLTLLKAVFAPGAEPDPGRRLNGSSRRCLARLMGRVVPGQDWGVSAAGGNWALKNGWLPRTDSGLWVVHSVGRVSTGTGRELLLVVLSDGHASKDEGITRVEKAAVSAVGLFL